MAPKGPIAKKMLSAAQNSKLPADVKKGMIESGKYSPLEYEKNIEDFAKRKDNEAGTTSKQPEPKKSTTSAHGQSGDADNEYKNDVKSYNLQKNTPKNKKTSSKDPSEQDWKKEVPHSGGFTQKELNKMTEAEKEGSIDGYVAKTKKPKNK
jgi:hypothetical protein|tara:strand:+ start:222 stop:674 length:453 start_codon:yes stop_codon:yes gene_type:complete